MITLAIQFLVLLVVVGLVLYLVNRFVPMDAKIKQILNITVVIFIIVLLIIIILQAFGMTGDFDL